MVIISGNCQHTSEKNLFSHTYSSKLAKQFFEWLFGEHSNDGVT